MSEVASISLDLVMQMAAQEALAARFREIEPEHLAMAVIKFAELPVHDATDGAGGPNQLKMFLAEVAAIEQKLYELRLDGVSARRQLRQRMGAGDRTGDDREIHRSDASRTVFIDAVEIARHAGSQALRPIHLFEALLASPTPLIAEVLRLRPAPQKVAEAADLPRVSLDVLTVRLRGLRQQLLAQVFGQDHAVHAFVEGLFNAEVVAGADQSRQQPQAIFVFAGPPGVGKTLLATLGADALARPFKRFDMSAFAGHHQYEQLVGQTPMYKGARAGELTSFVEQHPNAVLLFDEIEKASLETIQLFLQVLDAGRLVDQHHNREVRFRDTIVNFTTNAGRRLYEDPDRGAASIAGRGFHRQTILSALETELNPTTGQPCFPPAICSRLATGYPILFHHLGVGELERVVRTELQRIGELIGREYEKEVVFGPMLPLILVLREGARTDARTLRSQAEMFAKTELFNLCQRFDADRLPDVLQQTRRLTYDVEYDPRIDDPAIEGFVRMPRKPIVLLVARTELAELYAASIPGIDWKTASRHDAVLAMLAVEEVDFVLLDLRDSSSDGSEWKTLSQFDFPPAAARGFQAGQELLRAIRSRLPELPVFLLSLEASSATDGLRGTIDEDLLSACMRSGGVRGVLTSGFTDPHEADAELHRERFAQVLTDAGLRVWREALAARLGRERKVLSFDVVPLIDEEDREIAIRVRNLRLSRALSAADAGEVLDDVERPRVSFADVIGADDAKEELRFFIEFLRNPRRFAAFGLKPPKGVLLHGPPGTGKTLLARAMAGESDAAFLATAASSFVTIWQGSGPQNIRDLFARARRYAPAIIFIDEIDAVGKKRAGGPNNHAQEDTLNALLTEMDGFTSPSVTRPVFVLAATNVRVDSDEARDDAGLLDPALVRRFDRKIFVGLPDIAARKTYIAQRLQGRGDLEINEATLRLLAERSSGMSLANLDEVLETAMRLAIRAEGKLTSALLEEALESIRFGQVRPRTPAEMLRTARHEAGHAILYWLSGWCPSYVTVVSRGDHGGYMAPAADESERGGYTRAELEAKVRVLLGGRAAETVYYGPEAGLTTGASSDLERASHLARQMICRFGMDGEFGLLAVPELLRPEATAGPLYEQVAQLAGRVLERQFRSACEQLAQNRGHLDALVELLMAQERANRDELERLLADLKPDPPS